MSDGELSTLCSPRTITLAVKKSLMLHAVSEHPTALIDQSQTSAVRRILDIRGIVADDRKCTIYQPRATDSHQLTTCEAYAICGP
jgi:hypothetical protein